MPSFEAEFRESKGKPIQYQDKTLRRIHRITLPKRAAITVRRVSVNSEWRQGIGLDTDGQFSYEDQVSINRASLWADTSPKNIYLGVETRGGVVSVKNLWDTGDGTVWSCYHGAAMIVEEIEGGYRYRCNDGHPDDNFDDIVFEIIVKPAEE